MPSPLPSFQQMAETLLNTLSTFDPFNYSSSASKNPLHHRDGFTAVEEDWFMKYKPSREEAHQKNKQTRLAESYSLLPWDSEYTNMAYDEEFLSQASLDQELDNFYGPNIQISQKVPSRHDVDEGYAKDDMRVDFPEHQRPQKPIATAGSVERSGLVVEIVPYSRNTTDQGQAHTPYFKDSGICMEGDFAAEMNKTSPLFSANDVAANSWRRTENSDPGSSMFPNYEKLDGQECSSIDYEHPFATSSLDFPNSFTQGLPDVAQHLHVLTHGDDPRQYEAIAMADSEEIMMQVHEEISARFPGAITHAGHEDLDDNAAPDLQLLMDLHAHAESAQDTTTAPAAALAHDPDRSENGSNALGPPLVHATNNAEGIRSPIQEASHLASVSTGTCPLQSSSQQTAPHGAVLKNDEYRTSPNGVRAIPRLELSAFEIEQTWQKVLTELDARLPTPNPSSLNNQVRTAEDIPSRAPQTQVPEDDLTPTSIRKSWAVGLDRSTAEHPFPPLHMPENKDTSAAKVSEMIEPQGSTTTLNAFVTSGANTTQQAVDGTNSDPQDLSEELQPSTSNPTDGPVAPSRDECVSHTADSMFGVEFSPATTLQMQREVCNRLDALMPDSPLSHKPLRPLQHHPRENNGAPVISKPGDSDPRILIIDTRVCHGSVELSRPQNSVQNPTNIISADSTGNNLIVDPPVHRASAISPQEQMIQDSQSSTFRTSADLTRDIMMSNSATDQDSVQTPQDRIEEGMQAPSAAPSAQPVGNISWPGSVASHESGPSPPFEEAAEVLAPLVFATSNAVLPSSPVDQAEDQDYHSTPPAWSPLSGATNEENTDGLNEADDSAWSMRNHADLDRENTFSGDLPSPTMKEHGLVTGTPPLASLAMDEENVSFLFLLALYLFRPRHTSNTTFTSFLLIIRGRFCLRISYGTTVILY